MLKLWLKFSRNRQLLTITDNYYFQDLTSKIMLLHLELVDVHSKLEVSFQLANGQ